MRTKTIGLMMGLALAAGVGVAQVKPPAVIRDLGPVVPTPVPSPEAEQRIRLITSLTVQNKPDGGSVISFEATDFGQLDKDRNRVIATELYSLLEPKPSARALRDQIMDKLRDLENDLLDYVEITGPPREREPVTGVPGQAGRRP